MCSLAVQNFSKFITTEVDELLEKLKRTTIRFLALRIFSTKNAPNKFYHIVKNLIRNHTSVIDSTIGDQNGIEISTIFLTTLIFGVK